MDEHKKLNKSKFYNKNKYKNPKYAQKKKPAEAASSKGIELLKNWDRYEEGEEAEETVQVSNKDYGVISNRPIAQGTSFHFKKDKYFLPDAEQKPNLDEIFKIDLNLLSLGLETIPFHERLNIDAKYFKDNEISAMESAAIKATEMYESALKQKLSNSRQDINKSLLEAEETTKPMPLSLSSSSKLLHEENSKKHKDVVVQDLEDWLDDILK